MNKAGSTIPIRTVRWADAEQLLDFYQRLSPQALHFFRPWELTLSAMEEHGASVEAGQAIGIVAEDTDGRIVGHAFIKNVKPPGQTSAGSNHSTLLSLTEKPKRLLRRMRSLLVGLPLPRFGIGLSEAFRGIGLGKTMTRSVLQLAKDAGVPRVSLGVHKENTGAVKLYQAIGFLVVRELSQQERNDSLEMVLDLKEWSGYGEARL